MGTSLNGLTPAGTYPGLIKTGDNAPIDGTLKTLSDGNGNNLPMEASTTAVNFTGTLTQAGATLQPTLVSGTNIKTINGTSVLGSGNIVTPTTNPSGVAGAIQFSNGSAFASDAANLFWDDTNNRLGLGTNAPSAFLHISSVWNAGNNKWLKLTQASNGNTFGIVPAQVGYDVTGYSFQLNDTNEIVGSSGKTLIGTGLTGIEMTARLGIRGTGSTSATTSLLVQNSAGTDLFRLKDDKNIVWTGTIGASNNSRIITIDDAFSGNTYQTFGGHRFFAFDGSGYSPCLTITGNGVSQIAVNSATPNTSAVFDINSTTRGFLPPRMTTTQKNAIASPAAGLVVYDTTTNKLCCYNGSTWNDLF